MVPPADLEPGAAPSPWDTLRAVAVAVRARGGRALVVGGSVRDELLGLTPKDFDVEVSGIPADELRALLEQFGRVDAVGESFAVYKIGGLDVSLPRRESKTGRGHKGFTSKAIPACRRQRRPATRLHHQRDRPRPADGRTRRSVRRPGRPARAPPARRRSRDVRRRQLARAARAAVHRAFRPRASTPKPGRSSDRFPSTTCPPSASGAKSRNCSSSPIVPRSVLRSRAI